MRKLLSLLICAMLSCTVTLGQWRDNYQGPDIENDVFGVSFYTPSSGYLATNKWIGYTTDSGRTVSKRYITIGNVDYNGISVGLPFFIQGVHAFSADTLLVFGGYGLESSILRSTNGGLSWKLVYHKNLPVNAGQFAGWFIEMEFPGRGSTGFAVHPDEVVRTTDRGVTWQVVVSQPNQGLTNITFADVNTGYVSGFFGKLLKTVNSGGLWSNLANPETEIMQISSPYPQWLFMIAKGDQYYSNNGGLSFTKTNTPSTQFYPDHMTYVNDSTGYAVGGNYSILQTRNRGKSWEFMPKLSNFSYLGFGFTRLFVYDKNLMWACGANDYTAITTNGGGVSYPRASFSYNSSTSCTSNTVTLQNQSHAGYQYRWLRNGVQFATTYDASYTLTTGYDEITLIVKKGVFSDTLTEVIMAPTSSPLVLNSAPVKDTVCSNGQVNFNVYNSQIGVKYQVGRVGGFSQPVDGTGGTLILSSFAHATEDSVVTYTIYANRDGACGSQQKNNTHQVRIINSFPVTSAIRDTICSQRSFTITVPNSRTGYQYWVDPALPKVNGTGGAIQLPANVQLSKYAYSQDFDDLIFHYEFDVYAKQTTQGCGGAYPITSTMMVGRKSKPAFITNAHEVTTGQNVLFKDISKQALSYNWTFSGGLPPSTAKEPSSVSFSTPGIHLVQLKTTTKEGCIDSANRHIEVFDAAPVPSLTLCPITGQQATDSIRDKKYFVSRTIYEDEFGDRVVAGGHASMSSNGYFPAGYEGFFAARYNRSGTRLWYLETTNAPDHPSYNRNSHLVVEHAISDRLGYTYLLGHSNKKFSIKDQYNKYSLPGASAFLIKIDPIGRIVWSRAIYNTWSPNIHSEDYSSGSLLRGRNDEIYVITHAKKGDNFMSDTSVVFAPATKTGVLIQYNTDGKIVRKKSFPITYNNLRRYNTENLDNYDRIPAATWDSSGKIVIYGQLNAGEMTGNTVDGFVIPFNTTNIKNALFFVDTATLQVVNVKPLYNTVATGHTGIEPDSYAIDSAGNYYAAFTILTNFPRSTQSNQFDSFKTKSFMIAYDPTGAIRWKKQLEGFQPMHMLAYPSSVKAYGVNYNGTGGRHPNGIYPHNPSPVTIDVKKLTIVTDSGSYTGKGRLGFGSSDNVLGSFDASSGDLEGLLILGTQKEDQQGVLRRGFGSQVWVSATKDFTVHNGTQSVDTASTLVIYKVPVGTTCSSSYSEKTSFLQFDLETSKKTCSDSSLRLTWSSYGISTVSLAKSTDNGGSFTTFATGIAASPGEYLFNIDTPHVRGKVLFRITSGSLSDTVSQFLYDFPPKAYVTGKVEVCPYDSVVVLSGPVGEGYKYKWNIGDTTRTVYVGNFYREPYFLNFAFYNYNALVTTNKYGCSRLDSVRIDSVKHYKVVPVISKNATGDSLISDACGVPHVWFKDGVEMPGLTDCKIKTSGQAVYRAATRHPVSGCTSWKSNSINTVVTSVTSLPTGAVNILIYPNPAGEQAYVKLTVDRLSTIRLMLLDPNGKVLKELPSQKLSPNSTGIVPLNVRSLAAGTYFIQLWVNGSVTYRKITIVR